MIKDKFDQYIDNLQNTITTQLEDFEDSVKFKEDLWSRPGGGGGKTRVIENGKIFEKGGVNTSAVHGNLPESLKKLFSVKEGRFAASGLSLVLHPQNPKVPTVHANWRYFEMYDRKGKKIDAWFGGGQDLTPYYLFEEDARHFHKISKRACDKHHSSFYPKFKKACDDYFWNAHRHEARGIGGLFFDYLKATEERSMSQWFDFVTEIGDSFLPCYLPILQKRKDNRYTPFQREWQEIRRGRYAEFNLVHDRGTLFGLKTKGRIESILMSMPPQARWKYNYHPASNSEEEKLLNILKKPVSWVNQ